jgi:signal transduction histidine kinase
MATMGAAAGVGAVLAGLVGAALHAANSAAGRTPTPSFWLMALAAALAYGTAAVVLRRSDAVWLRRVMAGVGLAQGVTLLAQEWAALGPDIALHAWSLWLGSWLWAPAYVAVIALVPLLLPRGQLPSPRWRPAVGLSVAAMASTALGWALTPYEDQDFPLPYEGMTNPVGVAAASHPVVVGLSGAVLLAAVAAAVASLVVRWRRAAGVERQQLKWVLLGVVATLVLIAAGRPLPVGVTEVVAGLAMLPLPLAIGVAALRHGLWDVDVVISRSLRYGILSACVVAIYVVVASLLGGVLGDWTGAPAVATVAAALVALAVHSRLQRLVNRAVHGTSDEPHEVLARLGERLAAASSPEDLAERVLPSVVEQVTRALHAGRGELRLHDGSVTTHRADGDGTGRERSGGEPGGGDPLRVPLDYAGERLGDLSVWRPGGFAPGDRLVLGRLAQQAAVAAHTVLAAREAQRARETVVLAREEERRRLRRDLHDDVGPSLAALALQAETARDLAGEDPRAAAAVLDRLVLRLNAAVADVRALVHDLRPPTLDELGLDAALRELAARLSTASTRVTAGAGGVPSLPAAVEVAAYRIAGEAAANALRHAGAATVEIAVTPQDGRLLVRVCDDGTGLPDVRTDGIGLASMRLRAEELGGSLTVTSDRAGTRVTAVLPVQETRPAGRTA